ncbi:hypothetical protein RHECNPAF_4460036 [Rhizobium etli CNPAF512]|nr:hypothetical protein RHECNPAF_4460036 [Rhizobium etli CNPAF512]
MRNSRQKRFALCLGKPLPAFPGIALFVEAPRLGHQHDRNAVADRIGKARLFRNQFVVFAIVGQPALGERADQELQQFRIDAAQFFVHGRVYCRTVSESPKTRASTISVMAISVSARVLRSGASRRACFSAGPNGDIMASELTSVRLLARSTLSQSASSLLASR